MKQINIAFKESENKYITIYKTIKSLIIEGRLKENEKLPSKRSLASYLNVSNNTVMNAYNLLLEEGYLYGVEKSGYFVTENRYFNKNKNELKEETKVHFDYDFTNEGIDTSLFPSYTLRKITQNVMMDNPSIWLYKSNYQGDIHLRETIASYLYENKGMEVNSSNIIIVSSLEESLSIISSITSLNTIGLENPCYNKVYNYFQSKKIITFDVDDNGILPDINKAVDLLYVTPYNQFPMGVKMSAERRKKLLSCPVKYILEDDFDCDLISHNKVMSTLYSLNNTKVIYHGSFSHTICPGIRISYLVLPSLLIEKYKAVYKNASSKISSLDQALINEFIKQGYYYRHLGAIRKSLKAKKETIRNYLKENNISYKETELSFLLPIKDKNTFMEKIKENNIKINFVDKYCIGKDSNLLILSYLAIDSNMIIKGLDLLFK